MREQFFPLRSGKNRFRRTDEVDCGGSKNTVRSQHSEAHHLPIRVRESESPTFRDNKYSITPRRASCSTAPVLESLGYLKRPSSAQPVPSPLFNLLLDSVLRIYPGLRCSVTTKPIEELPAFPWTSFQSSWVPTYRIRPHSSALFPLVFVPPEIVYDLSGQLKYGLPRAPSTHLP